MAEPNAETADARQAFRQAELAAIPAGYSPTFHAFAPTIWCLLVAGACAWLITSQGHGVRPAEWLTIPIVWVLANMSEWRLHRDMLHKRSRLMPLLYERHTPSHHRVYVTDDMEIRSWREVKLILIPAWAGVALFVGVLPIGAALWILVSPTVACLFEATCAFYVASYEMLHLSFHLPRTSRVGRNGAIRWLARHHAIHHDPRVMQRWNMNVTVPLWDLVRGTRIRTAEEGLARDAAQRAAPRDATDDRRAHA